MIPDMKYLQPLVLAVLFAVVLMPACTADAQNEPAVPSLPSGVMDRFAEMDVAVSGGKVPVIYTPGFEQRAFQVRDELNEASRFFESRLQVQHAYNVAILDEAHWGNVTPVPYGFPHPSADLTVVFLPAHTDVPATQEYVNRYQDATPEVIRGISASGYEFAGAAEKMIDIIGFHELGHLYSYAAGIRMHSNWFSEFMANYFTCYYLQVEKPELAAIWENMAELVVAGQRPAHTSIPDFEQIYVGVGISNYTWYQSMFILKAASVVRERGIGFIHDVINAFPAGSDEPGLTISEQTARLEAIHPGFASWLATF